MRLAFLTIFCLFLGTAAVQSVAIDSSAAGTGSVVGVVLDARGNAVPSPPTIEPPAIFLLNPAHPLRHSAMRTLDQEMEMGCHKAECMDRQILSFYGMSELG